MMMMMMMMLMLISKRKVRLGAMAGGILPRAPSIVQLLLIIIWVIIIDYSSLMIDDYHYHYNYHYHHHWWLIIWVIINSSSSTLGPGRRKDLCACVFKRWGKNCGIPTNGRMDKTILEVGFEAPVCNKTFNCLNTIYTIYCPPPTTTNFYVIHHTYTYTYMS